MATEQTELKTLANLRPAPGSNKKKKRIGRGPGSGNGKTAGKGHKGQKARRGPGAAAGFEGGQMPLYMRLPKRGFKSRSTLVYSIVNLDALDKFDADQVIDGEALAKAGLIRSANSPVKLLGRGSIKKKFKIKVNKASQAAKQAIQEAGGQLEEI